MHCRSWEMMVSFSKSDTGGSQQATYCEGVQQFLGGSGSFTRSSRYSYHMRSHVDHLYLLWHTITLGLPHAWLIYSRDCKLLGVLKPLKQSGYEEHKEAVPSLNATPPPPLPRRIRVRAPDDVRADQVVRWPVKCDKRGCCKLCRINTRLTTNPL